VCKQKKGDAKMKKAITILFVTLFLLSIPSMTRWRMHAGASSNVIYVPTDFPTIQEAINNATPGDTIFVHNGTYQQDIFINKSVSLIGEDRDRTIINNLLAQNVVEITANDVSVCNFTVKNSVTPIPQTGITGIYIRSAGHIVIRNTLIADSSDGLVIYTSFGNQVSGNTMIDNTNSGASLSVSNDNVFSGNTISNSPLGLIFQSSSNNVFSGNTISNNSNIGISLFSSSNNNTFYRNNFLNPTPVRSDSNNTWNYGGEGNFWSNYTGLDSNGDGIGDTSYQIDTFNQDNQPLMGAFHDFGFISENNPFDVFVVCNSTVSNFAYGIGQQTGNRIIRFDVTDENGTAGFCRLVIPVDVMKPPYIVLDSEGEITPTLLSGPNTANAYLYFTYPRTSQTITVISSLALQLYQQLSKELADNQTALGYLNDSYYGLMNNYTALLDQFNQLRSSYLALNSSYQQQLSNFSESMQNLQNLIYIFAATTVTFLVATIYLSRSAHISPRHKTTKT
jgi:parallel beta-helix repeat protein